MESPGKFLKKERERRNVSLEEISKFTKIREHHLKAIEEDKYELLPPTLYVKGYLNGYAKYLALDPKDIVLQYQNYLEHKTLSKRPESEQRMTRSSLRKWTTFFTKRVPLWLLFISIPAVILLSAILVYHGPLNSINHFLSYFEKKGSNPTSTIPSSPPTQNEGVKDE